MAILREIFLSAELDQFMVRFGCPQSHEIKGSKFNKSWTIFSTTHIMTYFCKWFSTSDKKFKFKTFVNLWFSSSHNCHTKQDTHWRQKNELYPSLHVQTFHYIGPAGCFWAHVLMLTVRCSGLY